MLRDARAALTANTVQLLFNQGMSLAVFLLLARGLNKAQFGILNGLLAFFLLVFGVLSFGIDQLLVRKVAAGEDARALLRLGLLHNVAASLLLYSGLLLAALFFEEVPAKALLLIGAGKSFYFVAQVFKSVVTGQERFLRLLAMSVAANAGKAAGLLILSLQGAPGWNNVLLIFFLSDALEALSCVLLFRIDLKKESRAGRMRSAYGNLLREALPQFGTVVFAAALARFDWLYLAATTSANELAEYSFAYKAFELAQLPLLVIAPLLVPRFTRLLKSGEGLRELSQLRTTELLLALLTIVAINLAWVPVANWVGAGKYGAACRYTVAWLSLALPLLYYNNYLWSLLFAQRRTGLIFRIFAGTFGANVVLNILLVPRLGKDGAALAFGGALLLQTCAYHLFTQPRWRLTFRTQRQATQSS